MYNIDSLLPDDAALFNPADGIANSQPEVAKIEEGLKRSQTLAVFQQLEGFH